MATHTQSPNSPLRVYVAGAYIHKTLVQKYIDYLSRDPSRFTITFDWTRADTKSASDESKTEEYCRFFADQEIQAVQTADVFIAILNDPEYPYQGTFTELGVALGAGCRVILVCPFDFDPKRVWCHKNVFYSTSLAARVDTWEKAVAMLST